MTATAPDPDTFEGPAEGALFCPVCNATNPKPVKFAAEKGAPRFESVDGVRAWRCRACSAAFLSASS